MAEGGDIDNVPGKSTCVTDVTELDAETNMDLDCDPCIDDGTILPAKGYCVDCDEYLCENCFDYHRVPRSYRKHVLQTKEAMPKKKRGQKNKPTRKFKCQLHLDCFITYFCKTHDQVCCERCILIGHGVCKDVSKIEEMVGNVEDTEEFKKFDKKLAESVKQYKANKDSAERNMQLAEDFYTRALDTFRKIIGDIKEKDIVKLKGTANTCDMTLNEIESWQTDKAEYQRTSNRNDLFVLMKLTQEHLCLESDVIINMAKNNNIVRYYVDSTGNESGEIAKLSANPFLIKKINCRGTGETLECSVRDMVILNRNFLLLTDRRNDSLKLIDADNEKVLSIHKVTRAPWNLTVTDGKQVFMTQPEAKSLNHLKRPTDDLSDIREIQIGVNCHAIEFHDQKLLITCTRPGRLIETDLEGKVTKTFFKDTCVLKDSSGESYLINPTYSIMNKRNGHMYVTCESNHSISEISKDGNVKLVFKSEKLEKPSGIAIEDENTLLVCSFAAKMVFRVTLQGEMSYVFDKPLPFEPWCLVYDAERRELYVGSYGDFVYKYQL